MSLYDFLRKPYLKQFINYLKSKAVTNPKQVTTKHIEAFEVYLKEEHRTPSGKPIGDSAFTAYVTAITDFFHWLEKNQAILFTPAPSNRFFDQISDRTPV